MDCSAAKKLINDELDGSISADDARLLDAHVEACPSCARERAVFASIDAVLADQPLSEAPAWFEVSVSREIVRRAEARHRIESVAIPAACGAAAVAAGFGVFRAVNWNAAGSAVRGLADAAGTAVAPLAEPLAEAPDLATMWSQQPGAVGFVLAFAVVAVVFLGVSTLRVARQLTTEWRFQRHSHSLS